MPDRRSLFPLSRASCVDTHVNPRLRDLIRAHAIGLVNNVAARKLSNPPLQVNAIGWPLADSCTIGGGLLLTKNFLVDVGAQRVRGLFPIVVVVVVVKPGVGVGCPRYNTKSK